MEGTFKNMPLVTVIIPMFNAGNFIAKAIESVLWQSFQDWEMLVVDDSSTDNSRDIVRGYMQKDLRIKLLEMKENFGGPAKARNLGIKKSSGLYIAFLDADDLWMKNKLERQYNFLKNQPDIFLVYSNFLSSKNDKIMDTAIQKRKFKSGKIFKDLFLSVNFIACSSVMLRDCKQKKYYFDEDKKFIAIEDFDLWLRVAYGEKVAYINEPLVVYNESKNGISYGNKARFTRNLALTRKWKPFVSPGLLIKRYLKLFLRYYLHKF